jgi:Dna[CI] antecedent DciA-like protein
MRTGVDRRAILRSHRLESAPRAIQELFWRRYNQTTWRTRPPSSLQDLLDAVAADARLQPAGPLDDIRAAWEQLVPSEFRRSARVEGLSAGRLRVVADNAATRYVLGRQWGQGLIDALNAAIGLEAIKRIDFRLGHPTKDSAKTQPPRGGSRNRHP